MARQRIACFLTLLAVFVGRGLAEAVTIAGGSRVGQDLQALYLFDETEGDWLRDRSDVGKPLDLRIANGGQVRRAEGRLILEKPTTIQSEQAATKIIEAVIRSQELTVEAWIRPANIGQAGPARIVSLSRDTSNRNFTLGQEGDQFDFRLRATSTSNNGIPSIASAKRSASTNLHHLVFARKSNGETALYLNGQQQSQHTVAGDFSKWDRNYRLSLGNEISGERPWLGELHLVAIYSRALDAKEVGQNFSAGSAGSLSPEQLAERRQLTQVRHFETSVAPLLAKRCVECHDQANKKGGLDLTRKPAFFAGGESGPPILPGKAEASLLWKLVESDEMPRDREPLSAAEKKALRQWIDNGAVWPIEFLDPAIYASEAREARIWVRRLTVDEYIETVRSSVGIEIAEEARQFLPADLRADGFSNTAYNLTVDLAHVEAYARLAAAIVERLDVLKFTAQFSKSRSVSTDDTLRELVAAMGKRLLRGPLADREIDNYCGIATTVVGAGGDFSEAARFVIEAMLQSPRFIYRIEREPDGGRSQQVDKYELASRMSYIVWGGPPDEELMRAADAHELQDRDKARRQIGRLLEDPRAVRRSLQFASEWLNLGQLEHLQPDAKRFPNWDASLASDMRSETLAFFEELVWKQKRPLGDLLNAQFTFATPRLAAHYGLTPQGAGLLRYDLASVPARGGLLTQGSLLTIGGDEASMVTRGLFILHDVLRGSVNDPPPGLDTTPVASKPGMSNRLIAQGRITNSACGGCHSKFEPLAFGLEKFDGLGAFRERDEHGNHLREDGEMFVPGADEPLRYETAAELMNLLAGNERVRETITWKLTQFALGRPLVAADTEIVAAIHKSARQERGTYASVMSAILLSDLVQRYQIVSPLAEK